MKARTLALAALMIASTVGAMIFGYYAYYSLCHFIDGFCYMPLVEGSIPPVFWQPRTVEGQILGWVTAGFIVASVLGMDGLLIRKMLRA